MSDLFHFSSFVVAVLCFDSALHWCIDRNHLELSRHLITKYGANINIQDNEGNTPLHYAVLCEERTLITMLIEHGADMNIKNNEDESALDSANTELREWMLQQKQDTKKDA